MQDINFTYWGLQTLAMMLTALFIPRLRVTSIIGPVGAVLALALVNSHYWDAALFLRIPTDFFIPSLILIAVNGFIFWIIVKILPGIEVDGIFPALLAPIVFSACSVFLNNYAGKINWRDLASHTGTLMHTIRDSVEHNLPEKLDPKPIKP